MRSCPSGRPPSSRIGDQRIGQMLRRADAAGRAVEDDSDRLRCHRAVMTGLGRRRGQAAARLCYAGCTRVHVPGDKGAPPHRLPDLRLRHPIGLHRPRHDDPDAALARRVRPRRRAAHPGLAQVLAASSATWFIPGFTIESQPAPARRWCEDGHEIGASQLGAYSARAAEPRGRGGRSRPRQRDHRPAHRAQGARLSFAVVGPERAHHRSPARAWLSVRLEPDGRGLLGPIARGAAIRPSLASPIASARKRR